MKNNGIALARIPSFLIDLIIIMMPLIIFIEAGRAYHFYSGNLEIEWIILCYIPVMFFVYWVFNINVGKRIFGLRVVDAVTGDKATIFQLFKRSLLFSLIISFNVAFIIPLFLTKKNQSFHDMLANTVVIKDNQQ